MQKIESRVNKVESEILKKKAINELKITTRVFDSVRINESGIKETHVIKKQTRNISDSVIGEYTPVDNWEKF